MSHVAILAVLKHLCDRSSDLLASTLDAPLAGGPGPLRHREPGMSIILLLLLLTLLDRLDGLDPAVALAVVLALLLGVVLGQ